MRRGGGVFAVLLAAIPASAFARVSPPAAAQAGEAADIVVVWELRTNRRRGGVRIRPQVLPPGTTVPDRRFGDLRLECHVLLAFERLAAPLRLLLDGADVCTRRTFGFYIKSPRPLSSATVRWSGHELALDLRGDTYRLPLADRGVPDGARLVLAYR